MEDIDLRPRMRVNGGVREREEGKALMKAGGRIEEAGRTMDQNERRRRHV